MKKMGRCCIASPSFFFLSGLVLLGPLFLLLRPLLLDLRPLQIFHPSSLSNRTADDILRNDFAFITALSSDHIPQGLRFIQSVQQFYGCMPMFIYNLGLKQKEIDSLERFPFLKVLRFDSQGKPLVIRGANAFKGPVIAHFIKQYGIGHSYRFFFYGDSTTFIRSRFDAFAFREVILHGIVAEKPIREYQIAFTHPKMYPFFHIDREEEYRENLRGNPSRQVQSGLMMIDCANHTIREGFMRRWVACCENIDCLSPDGATTHKRVPPLSTNPAHAVGNGTQVYL
jgi:hypothetical protein